ncbi:MAG: sulfatase activating formylglycine-generating enzyme [Phenylobacterium sp.]|jgi:formylglycine-generating enzyme required for sulfatase activity
MSHSNTPPEQGEPIAKAQAEVIAPAQMIEATAFTPADGEQVRQRRVIKPASVVVATLLMLGAIVVWFLFTAKSVVVQTTPQTNNITITGGVKFKIADHFLMREGDYQLNAQLPGYYPLEQTISVGEPQNQTQQFEFKKLPGHLTVATSPAVSATIWIDDIEIGSSETALKSIAAGAHKIKILAPRYFEHTQAITINGKDEHQTLAVTLKPAWADVTLNSDPVGSTLNSNGLAVGTTPFVGTLLQGSHQLSLSLPGYKSWQKTITVAAGINVDMPLVYLEKLDGRLQLKASPSAVSVTLNGNYQGKTPLELVLAANQDHQLTLFKDGYEQSQQTISVPSGETRHINVKLTPTLGEVTISSNYQDALLYIDDRLMGRANQTVTLTNKRHKVVVKKDGYIDFQTTIMPRTGLKQLVNVKLKTLEEDKWEKIKPQIATAVGTTLKLFKPDGVFTMGASRREQGRRANEATRRVALNRPFYLGVKEISNAEFRHYVKLHSSGHVKGNSLNNDNHPVVNISWQQAALYCNWLSEKEKLPLFYQVEEGLISGFNQQSTGYRLPTEAEWAWSTRLNNNGQMMKYSWGKQLPPTPGSGNFADRSGAAILGFIQASYNDKYAVTAPVGSFAANDRGLYDLSGNVAEWMTDFYEVKTGLSSKIEKDPLGGETGDYHVIRGASWAHGTMTQLRLSFRDYGVDPRNDVGFRIARFVD